jgi:hypothetical protein
VPLPADFHRPFDLTSRRVTGKVAAYRTTDPDERRWLDSLIDGFQAERDVWDRTPELNPYFLRCTRLKHRLLHLAVCAFLHISYDLPRVIADRWPGSAPWPDPSAVKGQWVFFDLASSFPESLQEIAAERRVMGYPSRFTWLIPPTAMEALGHWVLHLRTAAWIHARLLHEDPGGRAFRERKMREAMVAALRRVSDRTPWSGALLHPPNPRAPATGVPAVFGLMAADFDRAWLGAAGIALIGAAAISSVVMAQGREAELRRYINQLGFWTHAYVMKAATDPERARFDDGDESNAAYEPSPA